MEDDLFSDLRARGRVEVGMSRELRAESEAQRMTAAMLRRELNQTICLSKILNPVIAGVVGLDEDEFCGAPVLEQFFGQSHDPYAPAKRLIDEHGRWARHVALENAIGCMISGNQAKEDEWRSVFVAVLELQAPYV